MTLDISIAGLGGLGSTFFFNNGPPPQSGFKINHEKKEGMSVPQIFILRFSFFDIQLNKKKIKKFKQVTNFYSIAINGKR